MIKFKDLITTIDKDMRVEVYSAVGELIHNGKISEIKMMPEKVLRIVPQATSREVYLELTVY